MLNADFVRNELRRETGIRKELMNFGGAEILNSKREESNFMTRRPLFYLITTIIAQFKKFQGP